MSKYATLIVIVVMAIATCAFGYLAYTAGKAAPEKAVLKQAVKTAEKETKVAKKNAAISKKTTAAKTDDAAKAERTMKELEDDAKNRAARECLDAGQLRQYNDPLGDAEDAGGRGVPEAVPAGPATSDGRDGPVAPSQPSSDGDANADVRSQPQRAGGAGEEPPRSAVRERLKTLFPTEA